MATDAWAAVAGSPPVPQPDEITQFFWDGVAQHALLVQRCDVCGRYQHPPLPHCHWCLSVEVSPTAVSGRAVLDTFTIVMQAFHPFFVSRVPYNLSVVELEEQPGLKMVTNVVGCDNDELRVGMPLRVTFDDVVPGFTLPYFEPA